MFLAAGVSLFAGNDKNYTYLALGDSVAFGLDINLLSDVPLPKPDEFVGYPEVIADWLNLDRSKKMVNTSCPGETSGSFIRLGAPDNGCNGLGPDGQPPFRSWIGLHQNYSGSQLNYAISQLETNKHINVVTLSIGGNDILVVLKRCSTAPDLQACVQQALPAVLTDYATNLQQILAAIRARYNGTLVLMTYYSPAIVLNDVAKALNSVIRAVGSAHAARFADGYAAFQLGSVFTHGDPCAAGLLVKTAPNVCDVHPSLAGQRALAASVLVAIGTRPF